MSTPHTPGPWAVDYNRREDRYQLRSEKEGSFGHFHGWSADGVTTADEDKANARLIAAAPDLLWIAERFLQCRRNSGNGEKGSVRKWTKAELERSFADLETHCLAAIAKATAQ